MRPLFNHQTRQEIIENGFSYPLVVQYHTVVDPETGQSTEYRLALTVHCRQRMQQRGIRPEEIALALTYGDVIQKQGVCFFVVKEEMLPQHIDQALRNRVRHLVIITNRDTDCLITCYKNADGMRQIRKKGVENLRMAS